MNKTRLFVRLGLTVLSAGLVSCAKDDRKIRDDYKAPPPVINNKGSNDLKAWDRRSQKSLDLQDSFDVSAANPARITVTTRCQRATSSLIETFAITPSGGPVKIFQILPADLLTADLQTEKFNCGFELVLQNSVGSKHIFMIAPVPLTDETGGEAKIEKNGAAGPVGRISSVATEGLRLRFRNTAAASAEIICQDMSLAALPFEQVTELNHFDFSHPELRPARPASALHENHQQSCRALIRQAGRLQQVSDRFVMQLPLPPLQIESRLLNPGSAPKLNLVIGGPLEIGTVVVRNPLPSGQRLLKISKRGQPSVVRLLYPEVEGNINARRPQQLAQYSRAWTHALPRGTADIPVEDRGDHFFVTLDGGKSVAFAVVIQPPGRMICREGGTSHPSENLLVQASVQIQEVDASGGPLENLPVQTIKGNYMNLAPDRLPFLPEPVESPCGW